MGQVDIIYSDICLIFVVEQMTHYISTNTYYDVFDMLQNDLKIAKNP